MTLPGDFQRFFHKYAPAPAGRRVVSYAFPQLGRGDEQALFRRQVPEAPVSLVHGAEGLQGAEAGLAGEEHLFRLPEGRLPHGGVGGFPDHPGYEVTRRQCSGFGGMLSMEVDSPETARKILKEVRLFQYAESLGGVDSLITYPMLQTHADVPEEERLKRGINDRFLRISVGIENADDLIEDLRSALEK